MFWFDTNKTGSVLSNIKGNRVLKKGNATSLVALF